MLTPFEVAKWVAKSGAYWFFINLGDV